MWRLAHDIAVADEFWRLASTFNSIEGFLDPREGYLLFRLAAAGPGSGGIVEIGSYCGRSTAFLTAGSRSTGREKVVAVDHFRGSPEHQSGAVFASAALASEGTTFHRFRANLARAGLLGHVEPVEADSASAAAQWSGPVRLLFIDGEHSYESVRRDFDLWSRFVVPGGLVALHDVGNAPGVDRLLREVISGPVYRQVAGIVSLVVLQRPVPPL